MPKVATGKKVLESLFATMEEQGYGEGMIEISLYDYAKLLLASIMKILNMYEPEEY